MNKNKQPLTLGYLPTRREFFSREDAAKFNKMTLAQLKADFPNINIVDLEFLNDEAMIYDTADSDRVIKHFQSEGVDALFIPHCNFGTEDAVARVARGMGKPVLLWGPRDAGPDAEGIRLRDSQCGLFATSKVMQRFGVTYSYILNSHLSDPVYKQGMDAFLRAANVIRILKNARIGQISTRPPAFYSVIMNEGSLLEKLGVEIIPISLSEIAQRVREIVKEGGDELKSTMENFHQRYEVMKYADEILANIAGRWFPVSDFRSVAIFEVKNFKPEIALILPSGGDLSYMSVAPHPDNPLRYWLVYYSTHRYLNAKGLKETMQPSDIFFAEIEFLEKETEWKIY